MGLGKIIGIGVLILIIVGGVLGYTLYQRYIPLTKVEWGAQATNTRLTVLPVQEKVEIDIPLTAGNPTSQDTELVRVAFDVYIEGEYLGSGEIPEAYKLPAMTNTTILIKDFTIGRSDFQEAVDAVIQRGEDKVNVMVKATIYYPALITTLAIGPIEVETELDVGEMAEEAIRGKIEEVISKEVPSIEMPIEAPETTAPPTPTTIPPITTPVPLPTLPSPP